MRARAQAKIALADEITYICTRMQITTNPIRLAFCSLPPPPPLFAVRFPGASAAARGKAASLGRHNELDDDGVNALLEVAARWT